MDQKGLSVLEVVLAAAVFLLFSTAAVKVIIQGYNANRQGAEYTVATQFAAEGLEAVRSIKNQSYSNLVNTSGSGLAKSAGNTWSFSGSNNTLTHNSSDNYVRTITVEDVSRDSAPPAGNIVASGGTFDSSTKKITSSVTWNFNSARAETISLITYLTNWKKAIFGDAVLVYGDTTAATQPRYRSFTDSTNTFGAENSIGTFTGETVGKTFKIKTSPNKQEAIAGYVNNSGVLKILCFDGGTWTTEFTTTVGGNGTNSQRFGIAYETNSGDALVVYSRNVGTTNEMGYRTKFGTSDCGSANWSGENLYDATRTSGVVQWIRMEGNPLAASNNIALAWMDTNGSLSAAQWNGSSFGIAEPASVLETTLKWYSAKSDVQSFDLAFESQTGNLMIVWSPDVGATCTVGSTCIKYVRYTNTWSAVGAVPTVADAGTNFDISSNPNTNEVVVGAIDDVSQDLSIAYWSGTTSTWTGFANVDTTTALPAPGSKIVTTGWLINGSTTRYVVVYNDASATNIGWYVGGPTFTTAPTLQTDFAVTPAFANPQKWYDIQMDPNNKDRLMFTVSDNNSDLSAKRLVMTSTGTFTWTNSNGSTALETSLGQATTSPFAFAYWRSRN